MAKTAQQQQPHNEDVQQVINNTSCPTNVHSENIKVAVRLRPFTEKERQRNSRRIVDIEQNTVILFNPNYGDVNMKKFTFDYSYWSHDGFKKETNGINVADQEHPNFSKYIGQEKVFEDLGHFLLTNALKGYNSALLAYGPTGSGKSYTVSGYGQNEGILPRFARALFEELDKKGKVYIRRSSIKPPIPKVANLDKENKQSDNQPPAAAVKLPDSDKNAQNTNPLSNNRYEVYFSMIEIYNEVVRDLLATNHGDMVTQSSISRRGLKVREHPKHGFFVENLTSYMCANKSEIERRIEGGQLNKSIAATSMNETSSRGHTIYEFKIKQYKLKSPESPEETLTTSVVQLVDLAGSERMAVHVTGQLGGESFIGSRSNSPYPLATGNERVISSRSGVKNRKLPPNSASSSISQQQPSSSQISRVHRNNINQNIVPLKSHYQQRFKESVSINQSLSALGNCIQVLSHYSQQLESNTQVKRSPPKIPYRDSVLTKLLNRCCLSGNSKVVIIATLSPVDTSYDDTLSTLRFADRAKRIRTHATVNQMTRGDFVDSLQKENERLKQIVDGRVTRSDDSSQTSNFDDTENIVENFTGSKINSKATSIDVMATPRRSRTTVKKTRDTATSKVAGSSGQIVKKDGLTSSSSNPSLAIPEEQMKRLVSPASRKLTVTKQDGTNKGIRKSRSTGYGLSKPGDAPAEDEGDDKKQTAKSRAEEDDADYHVALDEVELGDLGDIKEGLLSTESDESLSALAEDDLTNEDKIRIFNKLLSNSMELSTLTRQSPKSPTKTKRPKKTNRGKIGAAKQMSVLSSSLKKSNPYLSNLNSDEQLTGIISYILRKGDTIIGKSGQCDILLHGPEIRARHAKITRVSADKNDNIEGKTDNSNDRPTDVHIEPILDSSDDGKASKVESRVALKVNGSIVSERIRLNHCDRLLFGTNSYFVYVDDNLNTDRTTGLSPDSVTYDMAVNEVLKNLMSEAKNEAMIKEIKDYTYRPGTGKHRPKAEENGKIASIGTMRPISSSSAAAKTENTELRRSMTIHDRDEEGENSIRDTKVEGLEVNSITVEEQGSNKNFEELQEANYRDQLMEDTYEYALPVAEVNAVAKEMGIKVSYSLKILTGEEQISDHINPLYVDPTSDGFSSSSLGDGALDDGQRNSNNDMQLQDDNTYVDDERTTHLTKLDYLDVPPALYIKVSFDEQNLDFYWSKEKFQARRFKILELYGSWDVGGKSGLVEYLIDQTRTQGNYLIDPFVDDPLRTFVLVGHAQITLQPLSHLTDLKQSYDIIDLNDEIVGSISIQAKPCHYEETNSSDVKMEPYKAFSDEELSKNILDSPRKLLGERLFFSFHIISCHNIPDRYSNLFCQYTLNTNSPSIRTKILRDETMENESGEGREQHSEEELVFNHAHYISFDKVDEDVLNFLEYGFLTVQVLGQFKSAMVNNRSPTVVSTIINSINKYKLKLDQQSLYNNMNYSSSAYNSNTGSTKSNRGPSSGVMNSNSGASSIASTSATVNLFDQQNDEEEAINSMNGVSQENIIDMILTKRKLDRAENQLVSEFF